MQNVVLMVVIAKRSMSEKYISCLARCKIQTTLGKYGRGTASNEMMNYLGIGDKEKCILFSTTTQKKADIAIRYMRKNLSFKRGESLALTIPISSISSKKALECLIGEIDDKKEEVYTMNTEYEVIMAIANRGYSDKVMEAARAGGAQGGTVMHARGTGIENAEKFFGSTIGAEKEMILIVTNKEKRNEIMKRIKEEAGINTEAQTVMFSLPVSNVEGLTPIE